MPWGRYPESVCGRREGRGGLRGSWERGWSWVPGLLEEGEINGFLREGEIQGKRALRERLIQGFLRENFRGSRSGSLWGWKGLSYHCSRSQKAKFWKNSSIFRGETCIMYTTDKNNQGYLEIFKLEKRNKLNWAKLSSSWDWALLSTFMAPNFSIRKAISSHPKPLPAALE